MSKSVGISAIFPKRQQSGGVYSVFENLIRGFSEVLASDKVADVDVTVFHGNSTAPGSQPALHWRKVSDRLGRFAAETRIAAKEGARLDALLFLNYHTPLFVRAKRAVTVIHDVQYRHMPEFCSPGKRLWLQWCHTITLRKCHRVVTISHAVKDDLLRQYGTRWSDRIEVIWNPVSLDRFAGTDVHVLPNNRPYILCVAVDRPQKNLFRLVQAFAQVRAQRPELCLVLAGQLRSMRREAREKSANVSRTMPATVNVVRDLGLSDHVHVTGFVSDQQLGALYRGATMCVMPSLFEGFGMPAIESLGMGKPTLVSGLPVLREVTLDSAQYLDDPTNVAAMSEAILEISNSPERYGPTTELVERLRKKFSPRTIARRYLDVLIN